MQMYTHATIHNHLCTGVSISTHKSTYIHTYELHVYHLAADHAGCAYRVNTVCRTGRRRWMSSSLSEGGGSSRVPLPRVACCHYNYSSSANEIPGNKVPLNKVPLAWDGALLANVLHNVVVHICCQCLLSDAGATASEGARGRGRAPTEPRWQRSCLDTRPSSPYRHEHEFVRVCSICTSCLTLLTARNRRAGSCMRGALWVIRDVVRTVRVHSNKHTHPFPR